MEFTFKTIINGLLNIARNVGIMSLEDDSGRYPLKTSTESEAIQLAELNRANYHHICNEEKLEPLIKIERDEKEAKNIIRRIYYNI